MGSVSSTVNANVTCTCGNGQCFLILAQLGPLTFELVSTLSRFAAFSKASFDSSLSWKDSSLTLCVLRLCPESITTLSKTGTQSLPSLGFFTIFNPKVCVTYFLRSAWLRKVKPFLLFFGSSQKVFKSWRLFTCAVQRKRTRDTDSGEQNNISQLCPKQGKPNDKTTGTHSGTSYILDSLLCSATGSAQQKLPYYCTTATVCLPPASCQGASWKSTYSSSDFFINSSRFIFECRGRLPGFKSLSCIFSFRQPKNLRPTRQMPQLTTQFKKV